ncbi:hypothetical protein [Candidatus Tisiphia endosymbiont of Sialis lutaria]|uniref:hypothetical protein n=1 Tax=Candidatus Tisiphia endosymbiont of Sialis lutaria TaxID=2029164 RepID=UPI00312C88B7
MSVVMKSGNENDTSLTVANEAVNKVAEAVIAVSTNLPVFSAEKKDLDDMAEILVGAMNVLEKSNSLQNVTAKDIKELEEKAESIKSRSSIGTQIKAWFKSWFIPFVNFLKSPFSKQHQEKLQQATEDFVKGTEDIQKQIIQEQVVQEQIATTIPVKETPVQPSLVETPKPQTVISTTEPLVVAETTSIQNVVPAQVVAPTMPPVQVTTSTPTVMPLSVQVTVNNVPGVPPPPPPPPPASTTPLDPLAALGKEKKSVNQVVAEPVDDMVSELKKKLEARMVKAGEVEFKPDSPEHLKEFAEFDKLRKDEIARQARQDEIDAPRIAAALKAEAEKQVASAKVPPKVELNKEGGVPIPAPPPMPGAAGVQLPKPVVNKPPAAGVKVQAKPVQLAVDKDAIIEAVKGLRKLSEDSTHKKPTEKPVINFKAHLKTRESNSR